MPLILETPDSDRWAAEIRMLKGMIESWEKITRVSPASNQS
jgi:endonuclease IV